MCMALFGCQQVATATMLATIKNPSTSVKAQSVACLIVGSLWAFFAVNDFTIIVLGKLPAAIPDSSIIANCILCIIIGGLNFAGWVDSGKVMPNFDNFIPYGTLGRALLVNIVSLAMFAGGLVFFTRDFLDMYVPGVIDALPNGAAVEPMIMVRRCGFGSPVAFSSLTQQEPLAADHGELRKADVLEHHPCVRVLLRRVPQLVGRHVQAT